MGLPRVDLFGPPDYGKLKGIEGIVFHTPENTDPTLAAAVATAKWQATKSNSSGGSYHGILGHDAARGPMSDPNAWVLVKTVPFGHIAGSISTRRDQIWQPGRYPWIAQLLSPAAYADPNAYLHALCLGGRAAWWSRKLSTPEGRDEVRGALIALAKWVRNLEKQFDYDAVLTLHRHWQTDRSDPDGLDFADLVLAEYDRLYGGAPVPDTSTQEPPAPDPVPPAPAAEDPTWAEKMKTRVAALEQQVLDLQNELVDKNATIARLRSRVQSKDKFADQISALAGELKGV